MTKLLLKLVCLCLVCFAIVHGSASSLVKTGRRVKANTNHAAWIDSAVIYEITPNAFVKHGTFDDIKAKLPEIKKLGVNTIWLQPVYQTYRGGQGYDVTDYFNVRADLGTERQLADLIKTAKSIGLRVIFDFVPNHTSIYHPYALDCIKRGKQSPYYSYYQHKNDGKPYSSYYQKDTSGFVCYFWNNLVNLDYNNRQTQEWMLKAVKYWLQKYDLDGFRFDAIWGINSRNPAFSKRLTSELKAIKPCILLLAEDKVSAETVNLGFDAGYDWSPDTTWVSKWSWQTKHDLYKSYTIFNLKDSLKRKGLLEKALFRNQSAQYRSLRFIENNDVPRFIATHTLAQTKMAAALEFSLPGIPMIYNGQEAGSILHPYSNQAIFNSASTIESKDSLHLFTYYQQLIRLRLGHPALLSNAMEEVPLTNNKCMLAFERWEKDEHILIIINLSNVTDNAVVDLSLATGIKNNYISAADLLANNLKINITATAAAAIKVPMEPYGIRWLLLKS